MVTQKNRQSVQEKRENETSNKGKFYLMNLI